MPRFDLIAQPETRRRQSWWTVGRISTWCFLLVAMLFWCWALLKRGW